jgi:outer membrane protein assembly factor BamE (lipoprotein component of BamABCDE complex)
VSSIDECCVTVLPFGALLDESGGGRVRRTGKLLDMLSMRRTEKKHSQNIAANLLRVGAVVCLTVVVAGCSTQTTKHGHIFSQADVAQVQPGMSTDQVTGILGTPDTTATDGGPAYYYISSTTSGATFLQPSEVDRAVLAVYFNELGSVEQVANYTLKDGKVIDTIHRTTPAAKRDRSFIESIFKGVGKKKSPFDG